MEAQASNTRWLLVDDNELVGQALTRALTRKGVAVTWVRSGAAALEVLQTAAFEVVLSDFHMPGMTGHDFLKAALERGLVDLSRTRLMVMSGAAASAELDSVRQLGAIFHRKPVTVQDLLG